MTPRTSHLAPRTPHPARRTSHLAPRTPHLAPRTSHPSGILPWFSLTGGDSPTTPLSVFGCKKELANMSPTDLAVQEQQARSGAQRVVNDFSIQVATVNGSGSQTANMVLLRSILLMGVPVS